MGMAIIMHDDCRYMQRIQVRKFGNYSHEGCLDIIRDECTLYGKHRQIVTDRDIAGNAWISILIPGSPELFVLLEQCQFPATRLQHLLHLVCQT